MNKRGTYSAPSAGYHEGAVARSSSVAHSPNEETHKTEIRLRLILALFEVKNLQRNIIKNDKVDDAAWSMLLDLYQTHLLNSRLYVSALCYSSSARSPTTALRRLEEMIKAGLIARQEDTEDSRRIYVLLTAKGLEAVQSYLSEVNSTFFRALAPALTEWTPSSKGY